MTAYKPIQLASVLKGSSVDLLELLRRFEEYDRNMNAILNRGILFGDNVDAVSVEFTSNVSANTEDEVAHTLGKVPTGYLVYYKSKAGDVYASGTAWTKSNIYLKTSVTAVGLKLWVF